TVASESWLPGGFLGLDELAQRERDTTSSIFDYESRDPVYNKILLFFVIDDQLYTLENEKLCRRDIRMGKYEVLADGININEVACDGEFIYYIDKEYSIRALSLEDGSNRTVISRRASSVYLYGGYLFYEDLSDSRSLYRYDLSLNVTDKLVEGICFDTQIVDDSVYFIQGNDTLYKIPITGGEIEEVLIDVHMYYVDPSDLSIYYELSNGVYEPHGDYYRMDISGSQCALVFQ
ncbi:MAG: DUF5050 domain-containing protein, partial [Coriobacteriia bacterium]|nr:DUF5050 domain-containing protein [Coriobacteriia bacterium]